ncbi:MAG TPA: diguanylate cyclase [Candidatus Kapabacteria bacterium]|nr:diguanylate cyclase [Candidatus Kapabacteria bacterium]
MNIFKRENLKKTGEKQIKKHTIMIVDDENAHLHSMESLLSEDYLIITAQDGEEALNMIFGMENPENISLIISDQRMPGLTGIELFEKLLPILPKTIRIILTGFVDIPVIIDAVNKTQIYQFILKPFEPEDLKLRIKRALEAFENQKKVDEYYRTLEEQNKELEKKYKELEEAKRKLEESSLIDPLTGLRNRRYIENFIQSDLSKVQKDGTKQVKSASDVIFYILDVDNLKSVNNSFNHKSGDIILTQLTAVLQQECRPSDILVRWGNDEFLVVICFTDRNQAHAQAEHIRQVIANHSFQLENGQSTQLTCSIGFAAYPFLPQYPGALNWEQVITIVEKALHAAQKSRGNAWIEIKGTEKTNPANLYQQIRIEIKSLIANGELAISTSIPDKNSIVWGN